MWTACRIQQWYRNLRAHRGLRFMVCNYNDRDPISLENIRDIPYNRVVCMVCPHTKNCFACDAPAWAEYFATTGQAIHPCTRIPINLEDVWACFQTSRLWLSPGVKKTYTSSDLRGVRKGKTLKIRPVSPLFGVSIRSLTSNVNPGSNTKTWIFKYILTDPRPGGAHVSKVVHQVRMVLDASEIVQVF